MRTKSYDRSLYKMKHLPEGSVRGPSSELALLANAPLASRYPPEDLRYVNNYTFKIYRGQNYI